MKFLQPTVCQKLWCLKSKKYLLVDAKIIFKKKMCKKDYLK